MAVAAYLAVDADDATEAAMNLEGKALGILLDSRAITMTGLLALLEHLGQPEFLIYEPGEGTGETIFSGAIEYLDQAKTFPLKLAVMLRNAVGMVPPSV